MRKTGTLAAFTLALLMTTACDGGFSFPGAPKVSAQAIRKAADDPRVEAFYEARGWKAAWSDSAAEDLLEAIAAAEKHGIDADRFLAFVGQAPDAAHEEAGLTLAAISYAEALSVGMAEPKKVFGIYTLKRPKVDVVAGLNAALEKGEVDRWLESLAPQDDEYRTLSNAYVALRKQIAESKTNGTAEEAAEVLSDHAQQLALNLEHRRWLARDVPKTRIDVNTASALMDYYRDGTLAHSARVVVGKRGSETPQLGALMFQLVANPPWNVPDGIAQKEVLPKGPGYLASQGMYVEDGRVVQRPGPKAALGQVKFDLENPYAIYLHDTPSKASFGTPYRHKSHGCVRVHNAVEFARMLAREHGVLAEFDRKLASKETGAVTLKDKIPVRLVYHTVFIDGAGQLVYLPDPYGWDEKLAAALGMKSPRRLQADDGVTIPLGP